MRRLLDTWPAIEAEGAARRSFAAFVSAAEECRARFTTARLPVPDEVQAVLESHSHLATTPANPIPQLRRASHPNEFRPDWISIDIKCVPTASIVIAILRRVGGIVPFDELLEQVARLRSSAKKHSLQLLARRLAPGVIERSTAGWRLVQPLSAPVIFDGFLWGPSSAFTRAEIAEYRREAMVHLLQHFRAGLRTTELAQYLLTGGWVAAPVTRNALEADLEALVAVGAVQPGEQARTWQIATEG